VDSAAAAIYERWRTPGQGRGGGAASAPARDRSPASVEADLKRTVADLTSQLGTDWETWRWGRLHQRAFPHPLVSAFDLPTVERPGGAGTVAADGASYREIFDVADWDQSIVTNTPGQSAQPESPYYGNLLPLWANDDYFPLLFSRKTVESRARHRLILEPRDGGA
jgi:penicillin amidase